MAPVIENRRRGEGKIESLETTDIVVDSVEKVDPEKTPNLGATTAMMTATFLLKTVPWSAGEGKRGRKRDQEKKSDDLDEGNATDASEEKRSDTTRHHRPPIPQMIRPLRLLPRIGKEERRGCERRNTKHVRMNRTRI